MVSSSSKEFRKDCVYAIVKDVKAEDGTPVAWADSNSPHSGVRQSKTSFDTARAIGCAITDTTLFAVQSPLGTTQMCTVSII